MKNTEEYGEKNKTKTMVTLTNNKKEKKDTLYRVQNIDINNDVRKRQKMKLRNMKKGHRRSHDDQRKKYDQENKKEKNQKNMYIPQETKKIMYTHIMNKVSVIKYYLLALT